MNFIDILLAKKLSGGGGGGNLDSFIDGSISGTLTTNATTARPSTFFKCNSLEHLIAPNVTKLEDSVCKECTHLISVSFPSATTCGGTGHFQGCSALTDVNFPLMKAVPNLSYCNSLTHADFPLANGWATRAFYESHAFATLILRRNNVVSLTTLDHFVNTPFRGYNGLTGKLYVPSALVDSYKTATNWSTLYNNGTLEVLPIEGSAYE